MVILASASSANGTRLSGNEFHFVKMQVIWLSIAFGAGCASCFFPYRKWREWKWLTVALYFVIIGLMVICLFCRAVNGSHRWIMLAGGAVRLQPSEFAKIATVIGTAVYLDIVGWKIALFRRGVVPYVILLAGFLGLAMLEPDLGATAVIGLTAMGLLFVGGLSIKLVLGSLVLGVVGLGAMVLSIGNRATRMMSFLTGEGDSAHQLNQALIAIQRGGFTGVGLNQSMQKHFYLPEAHTDFIFAIGAEELGLVFSLAIVILFVTFFVCGMRIAYSAPDRLGRYIAFGATFLIFMQAVANIGVVTGCLPTKGLALPFISYGGTNLLSAGLAVGLIFNVGRSKLKAKREKRKTFFTNQSLATPNL